MPTFNYAAREINCKIVFYGPGLGGKTSNLEYIFGQIAPQSRGRLISLATGNERTLFFDFLPVDVGVVRGFKTRIHLYSVPGQVYYNTSRKLILRGADGVVFVADSQVERVDANLQSIDNLAANLAEHGTDLRELPLVIQYNKRDLPHTSPVKELQALLNPAGAPYFEAVARHGIGVLDTFREVSRKVIARSRAR
jgi:signal recognition particle receptor subunit beta